MKISKLITLSLVTICICSCSYDSENDLINASGSIDNPPGTSINYTDNIRPLMQNSCVGCHANPPTNGAPFSLVSFSQVSARANAVLSAMNRQSAVYREGKMIAIAGNSLRPATGCYHQALR